LARVSVPVSGAMRGAGVASGLDVVFGGVEVYEVRARGTVRALRHLGVIWRFDHKRKTITRRHWLWGLSRTWKSGQVTGLLMREEKGRLQVGLVGAAGKLAAEIGCWNEEGLDRQHMESVMKAIGQVMWWK
jgi:hypothetical protein